MEAINFMSQPLYSQKRIPVPTEYMAGQSSEPLWAFLEKRKISCPCCGLSPRVPNLLNKCYTLLLFNKCTGFLKRVNVIHYTLSLIVAAFAQKI
jgi:hypothetical protein